MTAILNALVKQEEQLEQLKQLLENELHLISAREPEALIALLKDKEKLLDDVQQIDNQISKLYDKTSPTKEEIQPHIDTVNSLVSECKYRTQINENAVTQGQLRVEHLRSMLMESRAKESLTYDKTGKAHSRLSGKGISA